MPHLKEWWDCAALYQRMLYIIPYTVYIIQYILMFLFGLVLLGLDLLGFGLLGGDALLSSSPSFLVLVSASLSLVGQLLGAERLGLLLVDEFHQHTLVLEHITLALNVELVVEMAIDLLVFSILLQETPEDAHPPHPQLLDGHAGVGRTLALTRARVTALTTRQSVLTRASARVNGLRLLDDQAVLDQTTDVLAGVGIGDLGDFIGIHPDLVPATLQDGSGQPLLQPHRTHLCSLFNLPTGYKKD